MDRTIRSIALLLLFGLAGCARSGGGQGGGLGFDQDVCYAVEDRYAGVGRQFRLVSCATGGAGAAFETID